MADYGVTIDGFIIKTLETLRGEMNAEAVTAFGASVGLTDDHVVGRLIALVADKLAEVWEGMEAVNAGGDPDSNTGAQQDSTAAISGVIRNAASPSTVDLTLTGTPATLVPALSQASLSTTLKRFETLADATIVATAAWAISTAYAINDRVTNDTKVYICTIAGTSAGSGGPTGTDLAIVDSGVTWAYVGEGTGDVDAAAQSTDTGPIIGVSRTIDTIETTESGWSSVVNLLDATLGENEESAGLFRLRRDTELTEAGTTPEDALRVDLSKVDGVTSVKLFINEEDTTNVDGVPPHAVEALIQGGEDQDIWDRLLAAKSAGAKTYGTEIGTATDSEGNIVPMAFSRPTETDVWCELTFTYNALTYPVDGDDQVKAAIVAFGDAQVSGKDVTSSGVSAQAFKVTGVDDVTLAYIGTASPAVSEVTVAIGTRERAVFDTSRIIINSSPATP